MTALAGVIQVVGGIAVAPLLVGSIQAMKARLQGRRGPSPLQHYRDLRRLFSDAPDFASNITAAQFIARIRRPVRKVVAGWTGIYQYTIDRVIEEMAWRCRELKLRLAVPEEQARQEFTVLLTVQAMNYLHSGGHRLFL